MSISIQEPGQTDREDWERLYHGYAEFYEVPMNNDILDTVWAWIFDAEVPFRCILAKDETGAAIGLMHYSAVYSPLRGSMAGFLNDLFVDPAKRGSGAVEALYRELDSRTRSEGWPMMRWITRDNNYRARKVYDKVAKRTDWITYEMKP